MFRLNDTFIPSHYQVEIRIILDNDGSVGTQFTAPGKVKLLGVNQVNTSRIVLHAKELTINESSVAVSLISTQFLCALGKHFISKSKYHTLGR